MGDYGDEAVFDKFFRNHPKESRAIIGSLIGYFVVFEVMGANWFLEQAISCGFWNGPQYCGGSEWWLLLYTFILGCVLSPGIIGGVSLGQKLSFTQMSTPERDELGGILTGGLWGGLIWAVLWMWSLPHVWGIMPFEHGWGWIYLWIFVLLPMGMMPVFAIFIDVSNRIKNAGKQVIEAMEFGQRIITSGMKGDDVRTLQELLNKAGDSIIVDGSFGNQTHNAVKKFQTENGLAVDGIVGHITQGSLKELMENEVSESEVSKEQEIVALAEAVEELSIDPNFDGEISNLRLLAEEEMEGQIKNLPAPIQNKIRAGFASKMDAVEEKARSKIPDAAKVAAGVGVAAGAVGAAAGLAAVAGVSERAEVIMEDGEVDLDEIQNQVRDLVEGMDIGEPEFDDEMEASEEISEPEGVVEDALVEETPQPVIEPMSDERGSDFVLLAQQVRDALTSTERTKIVSQDMTGEWPISVVINRVSRTMGIGLTDEYKNGKTLEGVIDGTDIAVSVFASDKTPNLDELEAGMTISTNCVVKEYRAVLKRFELLG